MFKTILCATDLNVSSSDAVIKAVQLAHQYDSKIIMLNVHEEFMSKEEMGMLRVSIDTMKSEFKKTALKAKNEMRKEIESLHAEDIEVEYLLKDGKTNKVICEEADNVHADLIVMGAMTYIGNAPNFMVQSIAEENNVKMPSFFGFMLWSILILGPIFFVLSFIMF